MLRHGEDLVRDDADGGEEVLVAAAQDRPVHAAGQAVAGQDLEVGDVFCRGPLFETVRHDRLRQRVLALLFEGERRLHQVADVDAGARHHVGDGGFALRDGPRLVEGDGADLPGRLQALRGLEQDAVFRADSVAHHDGDRGRETEGAGTADDQHRDGAGQGVLDAGADDHPGKEDREGDDHDHRHEDAGDAVRDLCHRRFRRGGVRDHLDDLGQGRVIADPRRPALEVAGPVDRGGRDDVSLRLVDRDALAREGGLVDGAGPGQDDAVHRDVLAGAHDEHIAHSHVFDTDVDLFPVPQEGRGLRRQFHEALQSIGRPSFGLRLEGLAHGDEGEDHGGGLEVVAVHIFHGGFRAELRHRGGRLHQRIEAVEEGGRGAERDQRVHVGRPVPEALETVDKELTVDEHDDDRQQHLHEPEVHTVREQVRHRPAPHHVPHREVHEEQGQRHRPHEPAKEIRGLGVLQHLFGVREGAVPRCFVRRAAQRRGAVPGVRHRFFDGGGARVALHRHGIGQERDRDRVDARHALHRLFHPRHTGGAAHSCHFVLFHRDSLSSRNTGVISSFSAGV